MLNIDFITNFELSILMLVIMVWVLPWKAVALWKAARNRHKIWFIALLVVNTLAILEIVYIFGFSKKGGDKKKFKK